MSEDHETEPYDGCIRSEYNPLEDSEESINEICVEAEHKEIQTREIKEIPPPANSSLRLSLKEGC